MGKLISLMALVVPGVENQKEEPPVTKEAPMTRCHPAQSRLCGDKRAPRLGLCFLYREYREYRAPILPLKGIHKGI